MPGPCRLDDLVEGVELRSPAEPSLDPLAAGYELRDVTGPALHDLVRHAAACNSFDGPDYLEDGAPVARADVEDASLDAAECQLVGGCQILDVDVVAQAGAVRRRIVLAEDAQRRALTQGGTNHVGNQMGLGNGWSSWTRPRLG